MSSPSISDRVRNQVDLKDRRCTWVGSDPLMVVYHDTEWGVPVPFMQAAGLVNDHTTDCFRYAQLANAGPPRRAGLR